MPQNYLFWTYFSKPRRARHTANSSRIVGVDEIDPLQGWISNDSPMAKALLKKTVDEEIQVLAPSGLASWFVIDIRYE